MQCGRKNQKSTAQPKTEKECSPIQGGLQKTVVDRSAADLTVSNLSKISQVVSSPNGMNLLIIFLFQSVPSSTTPDEINKPAVAKVGGAEDNRAKWAKAIIQMKCKAIFSEFTEKVKPYHAPNKTISAFEQNPDKNRYTDVLCLDQSRVVLKGRGKDDYIHASWMNTPDNTTKYICTQGPLPETLEDFWALVFQEKTKFVIMLCDLIEGGAEKCSQYWPTQKGQTLKYGAYTVKNAESKPEPVAGVKWSVLDVTYKGETFQVDHIFVTWWPDQLAPVDPVPMVSLYKWVKKMNEKEQRPILVHCSAGVGRTATFVGIDYANIRIRENSDVKLMDVIKEMRGHRYQENLIERDQRMKDFIYDYGHHAQRKINKRKYQ